MKILLNLYWAPLVAFGINFEKKPIFFGQNWKLYLLPRLSVNWQMTKKDDHGSEKCSFCIITCTLVTTMWPLLVSIRHRRIEKTWKVETLWAAETQKKVQHYFFIWSNIFYESTNTYGTFLLLFLSHCDSVVMFVNFMSSPMRWCGLFYIFTKIYLVYF